MTPRLRISTLLLAAAGALTLAACRQQKVQATFGPPVVPVAVAKATQESVPFQVQVVGTVEPSSTIQVKSQVAGQLLRTTFSEGQEVQRGALLFEIDPLPFQEAVRQAEAAQARDRALLRQAEATLARDAAQAKFADADAARYKELASAGVAARQQYDQVRTSADVARQSVRAGEAAIESARAAVQSDQVAIDRARLDLAYCQIRAPIAGRTGNLLVHPGNLVKVSDVPLVVINQVAPIFVSFSVPDEHLGAIRGLSARGRLPVRVSLQDDPGRGATGSVTVIDNTVDTTTGTIKLKASFPNADRLLWPGQFVNVTLMLGEIRNATVVPAEAVQAGQQGQFVYVVKPDSSVEPRPVAAGRAFGRRMVITKGVAPGETVVTDGQLRLFPGARVKAVDAGRLQQNTDQS